MQTLLKDVGECLKAMGLLEFYEYLVMGFWVVFFGGGGGCCLFVLFFVVVVFIVF